MTTTLKLNELVTYARRHSAFYQQLYKHLGDCPGAHEKLPPVDGAGYWHGSEQLHQWPVLTASINNALIFKTGGTTTEGRLSVFERSEWKALVRDFGNSLKAHLDPGDRVANLFFVGDLYASFIFVHDALAHVEPGVVEFPFTGHVAPALLAGSVEQHRINVLAGVPAQLLTFAAWLERQGRVLEGVTTVLYGGESLFAAQRSLLQRVLPNARVASIGYASVDGGLIGISDRDCLPGEHRMLERHSLVEIIDEQSGEIIEEAGRPGSLLITNLTRRLMPLIRYPVGDRACWCEPPGAPMRKFALRGRSSDSQRVRVGTLTLLTAEIGEIVQRITFSEEWQLVIDPKDKKDILSLKWLADASTPTPDLKNRKLRTALLNHYPMIERLEADDLLELLVEDCAADALIRHPRSGKHQRVVDQRVYDTASAGDE